MTTFRVEDISMKGGGIAVSVATFNDGYSNIIADDNCWVIVNGGKMSEWIFREAMEVLKQLPNTPSEYKPYINYLNRK